MIALQITELKSFMSKLLTTTAFDEFLLQEATLQMGISYVIDGRIHAAFYQTDQDAEPLPEMPAFIPYGEVRGTLFDLIKGKRTPLGFQVVLQLAPQKEALLFPEGLKAHLIKGLLLNIRYDGSKAMLTSGISYASFSMDKAPELIWDEAVTTFLRNAGIAYDRL